MPLSTPKDNTDEHWAAQVCRVWNGTVTLLHKAYPPLPSLTWTIPYPCTGLLKQGGCCSIRQSQWVLNHKVNISAKSFSSHRINLKFPQGNQNPILTNDQEREEQKIFSKKNFSNKKADQRLSLAIHFNLCPAAPLPHCLSPTLTVWTESEAGSRVTKVTQHLMKNSTSEWLGEASSQSSDHSGFVSLACKVESNAKDQSLENDFSLLHTGAESEFLKGQKGMTHGWEINGS